MPLSVPVESSHDDTKTPLPVPTKRCQTLGPDGSKEESHIIGVSGTPTFDHVTAEPTAMVIALLQVFPVASAPEASVTIPFRLENKAALKASGISVSVCALVCI
jgi:hypothetical protein